MVLFQKEGDYDAFERDLVEALARRPMRLLGYCVMPNHWHFVLWPEKDDALTEFLRWLAHTHSQRWHAHYHTAGTAEESGEVKEMKTVRVPFLSPCS